MNSALSLPEHTRPSRCPTARGGSVPGLLLAALLGCLLAGCKIVVTVPEGGRVVTEDGFVCEAGQTCEIEVSDTSFDSTFTAEAKPGYTFTRWRPKARAFCGNQSTPCYLSTAPLGGDQGFLDLLASDEEFYLEPIFVNYDVSWWRTVLDEIDNGTFATAGFLYAIAPNAALCDPGSLKAEAKQRALAALNQVRALHRLPAVDYDSFYDMQMQEASLAQRANNYLNHFPSPGDSCYTASAADGSSTSSLTGGSGGPADPAEHVFGWTNDNFNQAALMEAGHRRWNLFPELGYASYGQVDGYASLKVFGFGMPPAHPVPNDLEFVALPYGTYPWVLVSGGANPTPWSLSMVPAGGGPGSFNYFADAQVSVTDTLAGTPLAVHSLHSDSKNFGLANFLSWMVDGWDYDREYTVRVSNISLPGGGKRDLEYPVIVDRYHLFNVNYPLEATDSKQGRILQGRFNAQGDRDSFGLTLNGSTQVAASSEFSNPGFFVRVYNSNKRLVKSADAPFTHTFPLGQYTVVISHCDESGLCYQGTQQYRVSFE